MTVSSGISEPMCCMSSHQRISTQSNIAQQQVSLNLVADAGQHDDDDSSKATEATVTQPTVKASRSRKAAAKEPAESADLQVIKERFIAMGGMLMLLGNQLMFG